MNGSTRQVGHFLRHRAKTNRRRRRRYNYRRIALLGLTTLVALALVIPPLWAMSSRGDDNLVRITVSHGDSLWDLAKTHGPSKADPRRTVHQITKLNKLSDSVLRPGDILLIPTD